MFSYLLPGNRCPVAKTSFRPDLLTAQLRTMMALYFFQHRLDRFMHLEHFTNSKAAIAAVELRHPVQYTIAPVIQ